jgi:hypothetical protein
MILKFKFLNLIFVIYILLILISCRETITKSELGSAKTEENDDKIIIIDQKLNEWDITAAVEIYGMEPRRFVAMSRHEVVDDIFLDHYVAVAY